MARKSVGQTIIERLQDFTEALERGDKISEKFTVRRVTLDLQPTPYDPELVLQTRLQLGLSQALFAKFLGVAKSTVQKWEQGWTEPSDMACRFMDEIRSNPEYWMKRLEELVQPKEECGC